MSVVLTLNQVSKRFGGVVALRDVSLNVEPGRVHVLTGPNGCGKTTLLNVVAGFVRVDQGTVIATGAGRAVNLTSLTPVQRAREGVALAFQQPRTFLHLSVGENIALASLRHDSSLWRDGWRRMHADRFSPAVRDALEVAGLRSHLGRPASALSYGQSKVLDLLRLVARGAPIWLLDEPFAGVDVDCCLALRRLITLHMRSAPTVHSALVVCHEVELAASIADVTIGMKGGALAGITSAPQDRNEHVVAS